MSENSPRDKPLDPGISSRRGTRSTCICLFWTGLAFGTVIFAWLIFSAGIGIKEGISKVQLPHKAHYYNASLDALPGSAVRPLVDSEQLFDIAVSVWLRAPEAEEEEWRKGKERKLNIRLGDEELDQEVDIGRGDDIHNVNVRKTEMQTQEMKGGRLGSGNDKLFVTMSSKNLERDILEIPIYSDIVFRGLRLTSKGILTDINFTIPTARFLGENLTAHDLRGSVVLIPTSPSPLDYLKNYSSWYPDSVKLLPLRSWPFPLSSPNHGDPTLVDKAMDSFGFTLPLLEFHEIPSRCSNSAQKQEGEDISNPKAILAEDNDEDEDGIDEEVKETSSLSAPAKDPTRKKSLPVYERHPHVVTRSLIHVIDETHLFDRKAYNKEHKRLKANACGLGIPNLKPSRWLCNREYRDNGHWETRLKLEVPVPERETEHRTEWAYAPYLNYHKNAAGPRDLRPIPVNRENCSVATNELSETATMLIKPHYEEFMNVTWRITFSGRTPGKMALANTFVLSNRIHYNESEYQKMTAHDSAELIHGLVGHKFHDDSHPRRRIIINAISLMASCVVWLLDGHYWYTRTSTVSISIPGNALIAFSQLTSWAVDTIASAYENPNKDGSRLPALFLTAIMAVFVNLPALLVIKAVMRLELGWWGTSYIPVLRRAGATHRERASVRLDARTRWRDMSVLLLSLVVVYYFLKPHNYLIIASRVPPPTAHDIPGNKLRYISTTLLQPVALIGALFQLLFNYRTQTFAGQYRTSAIIKVAVGVIDHLVFIPAVVGRFDARPGMSAQGVIDLAVMSVFGWQALRLPPVLQSAGDEDEE